MNSKSAIIGLLAATVLYILPVQSEDHPLYQQARAEEDVAKAVSLYWRYFEEAAMDSVYADASYDFSRLLVANDRFADMVRLGDLLIELELPHPPSLNTIAWALAVKDRPLEKALTYSQAAVAAQRRNLNLPPPPERSAKAWRERQGYRLGSYLDTEGYIHMRLRNAEKALDILLEADSLLDDPEVHLHLAQAHYLAGNADEAMSLAMLARLELGEDGNDELEQLIYDAYMAMKGTEEGLEDYVGSRLAGLQKEERRKLVRERLDVPAKNFVLASLSGKTIRLSDYRGQITLVDFWATWCGPCVKELPLLQAAYHQWKDEGIELLAISTDRDTAKVSPFIEENGYTFPVLFDDGTSKDYDVSGIPTLFVVDQQGRIQYRHLGYRPDIVEILNLQIQALRR